MTPSDVLKFAEKHGAKQVDLKFIDLPGIWQHTTVTIQQLKEESFEDGFGLDGSSIRGWQPINASDMTIVPDPESARIDPFSAHPMLSVVKTRCDLDQGAPHDPQ